LDGGSLLDGGTGRVGALYRWPRQSATGDPNLALPPFGDAPLRSSHEEREALKTKVLLEQFEGEVRALSSVFHGIFFRLSQATANLNRRKMGSAAFGLPKTGVLPEFCQAFLHLSCTAV
jgi:hypothetical protein